MQRRLVVVLAFLVSGLAILSGCASTCNGSYFKGPDGSEICVTDGAIKGATGN